MKKITFEIEISEPHERSYAPFWLKVQGIIDLGGFYQLDRLMEEIQKWIELERKSE